MSKDDPARKHFLPLLSPYVDGELSPDERAQVEKHLAVNKESAAQVADLRAASGLIRLAYEEIAEQQDWSNFANDVMAKLTPEKPPFFERLKLSLSEMFTYQRGMFVTGLAGAAAALLIAVPFAMSRGGAEGYAAERAEVQMVSVDADAQVRPVVMETEGGDAVIWLVDDSTAAADPKKKDKKDDEKSEEELRVDPGEPKKAGEL